MTKPYVRFMVLGGARSGSNLVTSTLNSDPRITCFREIFNAENNFVDYDDERYIERSQTDTPLRDADSIGFLQRQIFGEHPASTEAVGFKFHYAHFWAYDGLLEYLRADTALRVVHLTRRNSLRSLASLRQAQATGVWFEHRSSPPLWRRLTPSGIAKAIRDPRRAVAIARRPRPKAPTESSREKVALTLSQEECRAYFAEQARERRHWNELFQSHDLLEITYEAVAGSLDEELGRVQRFLGLAPRTLSVNLRKQNTEPLHVLVANYDELRTAFADTEYASFFDN